MPTVTGKLQLKDYDDALTARGFDAFQPAERQQMINLGYRYVARSFPWSWESTVGYYLLSAGQGIVTIGSGLPGGTDSIEGIDIISDPYRSKLTPESQRRFETKWRYLDPSAAVNRGTPSKYYYYQNNLYLLPPPQFEVEIAIYFKRYLPDMMSPTDISVMPQVVDEVILDASLVRCHQRAHESELALEAQGRVDDAIASLLQDDVWEMEELQERTLPDDQWY